MAPNFDAEKRRLRREMAERRRRSSPDGTAAMARAAADRLLAHPRFRGARHLALYAALADELPSRPLFEGVRGMGKRPLLPRTKADGLLEFAPVERWEDLRPGRYGVLEPPRETAAIEIGGEDAVVLPGLAFDLKGHRLGRGKGYYDRTFPGDAASLPLLVGLGYEFQVVRAVPHDSRDRRLDAVVTERAIRWIAESSP